MSDLYSAFEEHGFPTAISLLKTEIQELYLSDNVPWIIGYSGGKDSTAVLQLVWIALSELGPSSCHKNVHVISTDTLVENPVVAGWVTKSLDKMKIAAAEQELPITSHRLTPEVADTFWVNLIGKGYPAPWRRFRWCTERLKINPSNKFIRNVASEHGETILVLGTRKAESVSRKQIMTKLEKFRVRDRLSPNASLPNSLVYSPIEDWTNDDVWAYIINIKNPWGYDNTDLLDMYKEASADNECPLVVEINTPSCGNSRFGCFVCTLVDRDRSMEAMINNDEENKWMSPLLRIRDDLALRDRSKRDFRRMNGTVQIYKDKPIPGPYTQKAREKWLRQVLEAQCWLRENGPKEIRDIELITIPELHEIRKIWVIDKHEFEDILPGIYEQVSQKPYAGPPIDDNLALGAKDLELLKSLCGNNNLHYELVRDLLDVERRYRSLARRSGLFNSLEQSISRHFYSSEKEAADLALKRSQEQKSVLASVLDTDQP